MRSFPSPRRWLAFLVIALCLSGIGGYQLTQLFSRVSESSAQRSVQLLEIEERLDDAAISLGRQIHEWKNMLLRSEDRLLYERHLQGFKDASIEVQSALMRARSVMQQIDMDTAEMEKLSAGHKVLLAEYLQAHSRMLQPAGKLTSDEVDMRVIGADRQLQERIAALKSAISEHARQQLTRAPEAQARRYLMLGLLGALSLFVMAVFGYYMGDRVRRR